MSATPSGNYYGKYKPQGGVNYGGWGSGGSGYRSTGRKYGRSNRALGRYKINVSSSVVTTARAWKVFVYCTEQIMVIPSFGAKYKFMFIRGNALLDMLTLGDTESAVGREQWLNLYQRYYVRGSSLAVTFANENDDLKEVMIQPTTDIVTTVAPTTHRWAEQPLAQTAMLPGVNSDNVAMLKSFCQTKTMFGQKAKFESDFEGSNDTTGPNYGLPVNKWYWRIGVRPHDGITAGQVAVRIKIKLYTELRDRVDQFLADEVESLESFSALKQQALETRKQKLLKSNTLSPNKEELIIEDV